MRAVAVFPAQRDVRLIDHPEPHLATDTQVKLRMLEVGICGTDREICTFEYGQPPPGEDYLVIGHESLGQVVEVGPAVRRVRVGDLVVLSVRRPCPHAECAACRAGRQDFCFTGDFTERGIKQAHGYMTEFVVDDEQYAHPVPAALRDVAVLVEPLTIAQKALAQVQQVQQRLPWGCPVAPEKPAPYCHRAVVLGAGPVGLLGALTLTLAGFQTFVYSRSRDRQRRAALVTQFGATYVPAETTTLDDLAARVGNIDLVFEAAGASALAFEVMPYLGVNGVFVFTGVPGRKAPISVDTDLIMRDLVLKNQVAFGTVNAGPDAFAAAIKDLGRFLARWPDGVRSLITVRRPMTEARACLFDRGAQIKEVIDIQAG
jgi:glucose 1-dehydrogenase